MIKPIIMPKLGETMEEGKLIGWKKKEGEKVKKGEVLVEVSTDKANFEIESPMDGILLKIVVPASDNNVPVLKKIAFVGDTPGEKIPESEEAQAQAAGAQESGEPLEKSPGPVQVSRDAGLEVKVSPLAKKLAREKGIDLSKVKGTGPGGRITEKDINDYKAEPAAVSPAAGTHEITLSGVRKITAERLTMSKKEIPHFYLQADIEMDNCLAYRENLLKQFTDVKISVNDVILKAVAVSLKQHKKVNSHFANNKIMVFDSINVGFAVGLDEGLYVPVIKNTDAKQLNEIAKERGLIIRKIKEKKLSPDDITGGTITVSNLGMYEVDSFSAIINPPQVSILAIGKTKETPVVKDGKIVTANIMKVTAAFDHRAIDGVEGAKFLGTLKEVLENPDKMK